MPWSFKYLGSKIHNSRSCQQEVKRRIGHSNASFRKLTQIWCCQKYFLQLQLRLFNSKVLSAVYYGSDTWHIDQPLEKKLLTFENMFLMYIHKYPLFSRRNKRYCTTEDVSITYNRSDQIYEVKILRPYDLPVRKLTTEDRPLVAATWC